VVQALLGFASLAIALATAGVSPWDLDFDPLEFLPF
jgi:hypothetical protein